MCNTHLVMAMLADNRNRFFGGNPVAVHDGNLFLMAHVQVSLESASRMKGKYAHLRARVLRYNELFLVDGKHGVHLYGKDQLGDNIGDRESTLNFILS